MARPNDAQIEAFTVAANAIIGTTRLVFVKYEENDNYGYDGPFVSKNGPDEIVSEAVEAYTNSKWADDDLPKTVADLIGLIVDSYDNSCTRLSILTPKQHKEYEEKKHRERCEPIVIALCAKYNVKPNSLAMISAIRKHYRAIVKSERHFRDDHESRMERWGACQYGGAGSDGFFADNDYATTKITESTDALKDVMRYLHRYCPLLMARWNEAKSK